METKPKQTTSSQIGWQLVREAEEQGENHALPLTTRLFPYIWKSARHMSARAISAWFKDKKGVELSGVSISRALRRPEMHWARLGEYAEQQADLLSGILDRSARRILRGALEKETDGAMPSEMELDIRKAMEDGKLHPEESVTGYFAAEELLENWFALPREAIENCLRELEKEWADEPEDTEDEH